MKKAIGYQIKEKQHFDELAEKTGEIWWGSATPAGIRRLRRRARKMLELMDALSDPSVMEIGCGTGALTKYLLEAKPQLRLLGNDIAPKTIQIAQARYGGYTNAKFEVADILASVYPPSSYDVVLGNSILHHLPIDLVLKESYRVLRSGGLFMFSEPNMMNPQVALQKNVRFIGKILKDSEDETAFFRWSLAKKLREVGFTHVTVEPFDFLYPVTPSPIIPLAEKIGLFLEKIPLLREISGSLWIAARKP